MKPINNHFYNQGIKLLNRCRGKKLVGIRRFEHDEYSDEYVEGVTLEFSNGVIIDIHPSEMKNNKIVIVEYDNDV